MTSTTQSTISSYVSDMLALESHIEKAIEGQLQELADSKEFTGELREIHRVCQKHIAALEALSAGRDDGSNMVAKSIKQVASSVLGFGAAAVDLLRTEKLPKNLRDDYTALSLACIGYTMLYATAASLKDMDVAHLAHAHLKDHAKCVTTLQQTIPVAVVRFLHDDGLPADESELPGIMTNLRAAWTDGAA